MRKKKKKEKKKDPIFEHSPPSHFGWFWPILTQFPVAPVLFVPRSFIICCCLAAVGGILEYNKEVFKKNQGQYSDEIFKCISLYE